MDRDPSIINTSISLTGSKRLQRTSPSKSSDLRESRENVTCRDSDNNIEILDRYSTYSASETPVSNNEYSQRVAANNLDSPLRVVGVLGCGRSIDPQKSTDTVHADNPAEVSTRRPSEDGSVKVLDEQRTHVLYHKPNCRKRTLKGCSNGELRRSRTMREALADAKASEDYAVRATKDTSPAFAITHGLPTAHPGRHRGTGSAAAVYAPRDSLPSFPYVQTVFQEGHQIKRTWNHRDAIEAIKSTIASIKDLKSPLYGVGQISCLDGSPRHQPQQRNQYARCTVREHTGFDREVSETHIFQNQRDSQDSCARDAMHIEGCYSNKARLGEVSHSEVQSSYPCPSTIPLSSPPQEAQIINQRSRFTHLTQLNTYDHVEARSQLGTMSSRAGARSKFETFSQVKEES